MHRTTFSTKIRRVSKAYWHGCHIARRNVPKGRWSNARRPLFKCHNRLIGTCSIRISTVHIRIYNVENGYWPYFSVEGKNKEGNTTQNPPEREVVTSYSRLCATMIVDECKNTDSWRATYLSTRPTNLTKVLRRWRSQPWSQHPGVEPVEKLLGKATDQRGAT